MNVSLPTKEKLFIGTLVITGALATANAVVTGNKIFFAPMLLLGLWAWTRFATRYPAAALIIIVFFVENCFSIFSFGIRSRLLSDIGIVLMLPLIALNIRRVWEHIVRYRSPYAIGILLFFIAILNSLYWGAQETFGQPMSIGLIVARKYLFFLSYFFMVAVGARREECYRFMKYLAWIGICLAFLCIIEVALGGGVIFKYAHGIGLKRAGMLRIHVGSFLIVYSVIYSFIKYHSLPKSNPQRLGYGGALCLGLFTLMFIVMTRAILLGLFATFSLWLVSKITHKKHMFLCATVSLTALLILTGVGTTVLDKTFIGKIVAQTTTELHSDKGNISVRKEGAKYYLELMWQKAPLTGVGRFSDFSFPNNPITRAADMFHYYIVDVNGITTLVYFGLQGLLLLTYFIIITFKDTVSAMKNEAISRPYHFRIIFFLFIFILATPTLNNIIVERMLVYSGLFFYLLSQVPVPDKNNYKKRLR